MNSSILEQRNRFALIGVLMTIVSLMFYSIWEVLWSIGLRNIWNRSDDRDNLCDE